MLRIPDHRKRHLIEMLREVARKHDEMRYASADVRAASWFCSGICFAVDEAELTEAVNLSGSYVRRDINKLLLNMQLGYESDCYLVPNPPAHSTWANWNQRANMCLFMALWLEDTL